MCPACASRAPRARRPQIQGFVEVADQKQMTSTITYSALDFDAYNFSTTADGQTDLIFAMKVCLPPHTSRRRAAAA